MSFFSRKLFAGGVACNKSAKQFLWPIISAATLLFLTGVWFLGHQGTFSNLCLFNGFVQPMETESMVTVYKIDEEVVVSSILTSICTLVSETEDGFFRHCEVPSTKEAREITFYVHNRMRNYTGKCPDEALRFHCLEYAARHVGWCNWTKVPDTPAFPPKSFLNQDVCQKLLSQPAAKGFGDKDDHKLVFFYPSYGHLPELKLSIGALQHPNHIFLIQVDEPGQANEAFIQGVLDFAATVSNICVVRQGYVVYATASQVLVLYPAMAWAEKIPGWTHFFAMGSQTYPLRPLQALRNLSRENPTENFFDVNFRKVKPETRSQERRTQEMLPYCREKPTANDPERRDYLGEWKDEDGQLRNWNSRIDWLDIQLGGDWEYFKAAGNEVTGLSREFLSFLIHDTRAKMFKQFFSYLPIACEHLLPSIAGKYFPDTVKDRNMCYMTWTGVHNNIIQANEWPTLTNPETHYWFARKFNVPETNEIMARVEKELRNASSVVN